MSARAQMYALSRVCRRPADTLMRWLASYCGFGGPCIKIRSVREESSPAGLRLMEDAKHKD